MNCTPLRPIIRINKAINNISPRPPEGDIVQQKIIYRPSFNKNGKRLDILA